MRETALRPIGTTFQIVHDDSQASSLYDSSIEVVSTWEIIGHVPAEIYSNHIELMEEIKMISMERRHKGK